MRRVVSWVRLLGFGAFLWGTLMSKLSHQQRDGLWGEWMERFQATDRSVAFDVFTTHQMPPARPVVDDVRCYRSGAD